MVSKSIAIITARGGSKRIPKKNIKLFHGRPIIEYSIQAALESGCYDQVMVSTDDYEIREIALRAGAMVPFMRSDKNSNDYAATHEVLLEVIEEYKKRDQEFQYLTCIYPTAPFVTAQKLRTSMSMLMEQNVDTVIPVVAFSFPPQRGVVIREGKVSFQSPENMFVRSQDLESIYHDCGQFYSLNVKQFLEQKRILMDSTIPYIMSELEVQDIDNETDWLLAELKYKIMMENLRK